jgi:signal transduction histidine kinase
MMVRHELTKSNIAVETDFQRELPAIKVDNTKFEQVLVNLLMNSIHAMQNSGRPGQLIIRTRTGVAADQVRDEGRRSGAPFRRGVPVVFTQIEDNGVGIPPEHLSKVFDPFYTTKKRGQGTGLGLWVVAQLVRAHGGEIDLDSKLGAGTLVRVSWPSGTTSPTSPGGSSS